MSKNELGAAVDTPRRRVGLGRGLDAVIAGAEEESPPAHVWPVSSGDLRLSIAESAAGTTVTVSDERGRSQSVDGDWTEAGVRDAAIRAVAGLAGVTVSRVTAAVLPMDDSMVMTLLLEAEDGARHAGAAVISGTVAFAAVEAAVAAIGLGAG
jgi:hypothetical protein